jgi:hypothetical protein
MITGGTIMYRVASSIGCAALVATSITASAAGSPAVAAPAVATPAATRAPAVFEGTASLGAGQAARLDLLLWPNDAALAAVRPGQPVGVRAFASDVVRSGGAYALRIDPAAVPARYREPDGSVHTHLMVSTARGTGRWNATARPVVVAGRPQWQLADRSAPGATQPVAYDLDLTAEAGLAVATRDVTTGRTLTRDVLAMQPPGVAAGRQAAAPAAGAAAPTLPITPAVPTCDFYPGRVYYDIAEKFGYARSFAEAPMTLTEARHSRHSVGVGAEVSVGVWRVAGSQTKDLTRSSYVVVSKVHNIAMINRMTYRDWWWRGSGCAYYRERRPGLATALMDGDDRPKIAAARWGNSRPRCQLMVDTDEAGGERDVANSTVQGGIDIGPINVNAQAGWDDQVKQVWHFTSRSWLCGSIWYRGWLHSPQAEAHAVPRPGPRSGAQ